MRLLALLLLVSVTAVVAYKANDATSASTPAKIVVGGTLATYSEQPDGAAGHVSDRSEESWVLKDRHGKPIGRMFFVCRWVTQSQRFCVGSLRLPLGAVTTSGVTSSPFGGTYAVTGGTGRYLGAGGQAVYVTTGLSRMILTVTLI
jgi:hypothetical protein